MELRARGDMFLLEPQDKAPPNSKPRGRKKDPKLSPLSERVLKAIPGPSNYNYIGRVGEWRLISGLFVGSGFRYDFNISMALVGCLAVADFCSRAKCSCGCQGEGEGEGEGEGQAEGEGEGEGSRSSGNPGCLYKL